MQQHGLKADDIDSITAFVSDNTLHHCGWPYEGERIQSVLSAQMNLRYGIAVMALEGRAGVEQFADSKIRDPEILNFIARIVVEHEPQFEGQNGRYRVACRLVVRTKGGKTYASEVLYRKGSPEDPMTDERNCAKNLTGSPGIWVHSKAARIAHLVANLEMSPTCPNSPACCWRSNNRASARLFISCRPGASRISPAPCASLRGSAYWSAGNLSRQ